MKSKKDLDDIIRAIDKFDGLLSLIKGVTEISIQPTGKMLLSANLPSYVIFSCMGDRGRCSVKIPMKLIESLAQDPVPDKTLANLYDKMVIANVQPTNKNHDFFYLSDKDRFVRLS